MLEFDFRVIFYRDLAVMSAEGASGKSLVDVTNFFGNIWNVSGMSALHTDGMQSRLFSFRLC